MIIDTHSHIYYVTGEDYSYADDIELVLERAKAEGVRCVLLPNVDLDSFPQMMSLVASHPEMCYPMIGLHPTSVGAEYSHILDRLEVELRRDPTRFVGIGEIGLDYHWDLTYKEEMIKALRRQIGWALEYDLPVSVHSRDAEADVISILSEYPDLKGVIHAYGGSREVLMKALSLENFMIGITGVLTFKNGALKEVIKGVLPLDRIVIETDAPYLTPVPYRGKRNEPSYLKYVVKDLASLYECEEEELKDRLFENSVKMFNLAL